LHSCLEFLRVSMSSLSHSKRMSQRTFNKSMGYMTECSATPAKAPAAMLAARLKFGGRPS
jgi:hypothetical protein